MINLPAGTLLYHGTDARETFAVPSGPAWFAQDWTTAAKWAGWGSVDRGERRVLQCRTQRPIELRDTQTRAAWEEFCRELCGDEDAYIWQVAHAVAKHGWEGWYGRTEILLADTSGLRGEKITKVPATITPWGRHCTKGDHENTRANPQNLPRPTPPAGPESTG